MSNNKKQLPESLEMNSQSLSKKGLKVFHSYLDRAQDLKPAEISLELPHRLFLLKQLVEQWPVAFVMAVMHEKGEITPENALGNFSLEFFKYLSKLDFWEFEGLYRILLANPKTCHNILNSNAASLELLKDISQGLKDTMAEKMSAMTGAIHQLISDNLSIDNSCMKEVLYQFILTDQSVTNNNDNSYRIDIFENNIAYLSQFSKEDLFKASNNFMMCKYDISIDKFCKKNIGAALEAYDYNIYTTDQNGYIVEDIDCSDVFENYKNAFDITASNVNVQAHNIAQFYNNSMELLGDWMEWGGSFFHHQEL